MSRFSEFKNVGPDHALEEVLSEFGNGMNASHAIEGVAGDVARSKWQQ